MRHWLRKATKAAGPKRDAGDGATDLPIRVALAAAALGLLVGAMVSPAESGPAAGPPQLDPPVHVEGPADLSRSAIDGKTAPDGSAAGP